MVVVGSGGHDGQVAAPPGAGRVDERAAGLGCDDAVPGMEAVPRRRHAPEMVPQRAQGQPGLDHRIEPAVQPSGHLPGDGGVALLDLVGLDEGDAACRGGGESGEGLHDGTLGLGAGDGERAVGAEPQTRDQRADLLPAPAGPERDVELLPVAPAAHPDQPEVAHRGARRGSAGLEVRDLPTGAHELQRMPGAQDAPAGDDGPAVRSVTGTEQRGRRRRTAARMASAASQGRAWPKTALPATKTFAPALAATGAVSTSMPPSTSTSTAREPASTARRTCSTLPMTSAMKLWPPKPGNTVMHRTRSTLSR